MNIISIDYGTKNIGLAMNNDTEIAFPLKSIINNEKAIEEIKDVYDEEMAGKIIIGMPTKMNRTAGALAEEIKAFAEKLKEAGLQIEFEDELLSSEMTKKMMEGYKGKYDKDAVEAAVILQTYLERNI
ncbi:MAG: Holliday junction resolvase RuvX [Parcubacteria group bacterium CG10_big_fil_rev_8_21_14_0_10_36_14]|nr:MAG: Holliday junction resolvase RuvX [Parcubacteria group bacterium CG10_big_fil_rev_8_21_14_0_10_36_14]